MSSYPLKFRHVEAGIYAGGAPSQDNIDTLAKLGVKYVLSLDNSVAAKIKPILDQRKIKQILIPIEPIATLNDNLKYLARNISRILSGYQPIYVHCLQGQDRTGLAIALYRVTHNHWTPERAVQEAKIYNYGAGVSPQTQKMWYNVLLEAAGKSGTPMEADDGRLNYRPSQLVYPPTVSLQSGAPEGIYPISFAPYQPISLESETNRMPGVGGEGIPMVGNRSSVGPAGGAGYTENQGLLNVKTYS